MDNSELLIREMLSRADMRLQAQQALAVAADARAMQFVATCVAGAALIIAIGNETLDWHHYVIAGMLAISAICAFWAAKPVEWHAPGMQPSAWYEDIARDAPVAEALRELCHHLEHSIDTNNKILSENAQALRFAAVVAIMAPIFGALAMAF